ncbi:MAG: hypothetical protein IKG93_02865 [Clostridiales bacterium]|nr:hypothetical protein [Clostridiales bacterium]
MDKEQIEKMLSQIDDEYIAETVTYQQHSLIRKVPPSVRVFARIAAAVLAVLAASTLTAYATIQLIRNVTVRKEVLYVGNGDDIDDAITAPEETTFAYDILEDTDGDQSVNWIHRRVEVIDNEYKTTRYQYNDYSKALADHELDRWFNEIPGKVENIEVGLTEDHEMLMYYSIDIAAHIGDGRYYLSETKTPNYDQERHTYMQFLDDMSNERTYKSKSGQTYTIVDDHRDDGRDLSFVMISYDYYYGVLTCENLTDEQIHEILDALII